MKMNKRAMLWLLVMTIVLWSLPGAFAADTATINTAVEKTAAYMYQTVASPQVGSVGGEWAVIGLARSGYAVPDAYYENYCQTVKTYVANCGGVLHAKKYTEYSRVILGLTAAGYDPRNVSGYNLTIPLGDFDKTIWQGINGPIWALISLDSDGYSIPQNTAAAKQATRDMYIAEILRRQLADGGFNLTAGANGAAVDPSEKADPDLTGMALQALAKYQDKPEVKTATDKALECLSAMQKDNGGYSSWGTDNSESAVQVLVALCELGISIDDLRFVKNGHTLVDNILTFQNSEGSFKHTADNSGNNQMATEQAFYGLVAAQRMTEGKSSLYRMGDAVKRGVAVNFSITFDSAGGSAVAPITQQAGSIVTAPLPPIRDGYTFAGWFVSIEDTHEYVFNTMPQQNITLTAKWTPIIPAIITITFDSQGGSEVAPLSGTPGSSVTAPAAPRRSGYTFLGWYSSVSSQTSYTFGTIPAQDITLYAKWSQNSSGGGGGGGSNVDVVTTTPTPIPSASPTPTPSITPTSTPVPTHSTENSDNTAWTNPYTDVAETDWCYPAVKYVAQKSVMNGDGSLFSPNTAVTRSMLVTMLYRYEGKPQVSGESPFTDVASGQWYSDAVQWAAKQGIVSGYGGGLFGLNDPVTREQLVTVIYNYSRIKGLNVSQSAALDGYSDAGQISQWATDAVQWAKAEGLISGRSQTELAPHGTANRAEVAAIFMRYAEGSKNKQAN